MSNNDFRIRLAKVDKHRKELLLPEERLAIQVTSYIAVGSMLYTSYRLTRYAIRTILGKR